MAKPSLDELIEWLKQNELNRFEVFDIDADKPVNTCLSFQQLNDKYASPSNYFKSLMQNGIYNIQINRKKKNGSSHKKIGCGLNFALGKNNDNVAASGGLARPAATQQPSMPGLSFADTQTLDFYNKARNYEELLPKYQAIEAELRTTKEKLDQKEKELYKIELGKEKEPSFTEQLVKGFAQDPKAILEAFMQLKGQGNANGLNAPTPQPQQPQLSPTKRMTVDLITNPQIPDETVSGAYHLLVQALSGNQELVDEYVQILRNHKIIE